MLSELVRRLRGAVAQQANGWQVVSSKSGLSHPYTLKQLAERVHRGAIPAGKIVRSSSSQQVRVGMMCCRFAARGAAIHVNTIHSA
jgi:hypothetical protein